MKNERMNNEMGRERFGLIGYNRNKSLHPSVIIPTFLFSLYFIRRERFISGTFLHIYTNKRRGAAEKGKCVCISANDRVHTLGRVSSDIVL